MTTVYLSLGSNIGDRRRYLEKTLAALDKLPQTEVIQVSSFYETAAWGLTDQDDFLNICCQLETALSPQDLLSYCQEIEKDLHRERQLHWGPRTIDIDILLCGDEVIAEENLTVPHPYMLKRAFVLVPLLEIAPDVVVAGQKASEVLESLDSQDVRKLAF